MGVIFRAGWLVRAVHSLFQYVDQCEFQSDEAGKAAAGWKGPKIDGRLLGGFPPTLEGLLQDDKMVQFVERLFASSNETMERKRFWAAAILRHFDSFKSDMDEEPEGFRAAAVKGTHPFLDRVTGALSDCRVSDDEFGAWKQHVRKNFVSKNMFGLQMHHIQAVLGENGAEDMRTLAGTFSNMVNMMYRNSQQLGVVQSENQNLREQVKGLRDVVGDLKSHIHQLTNVLGQLVGSGLTTSLGGATVARPEAAEGTPVVPVAVSRPPPGSFIIFVEQNRGRDYNDLQKVFFVWFSRDLPSGWMSIPKTKALRTKFTHVKKSVGWMVMLCRTYPRERPSDVRGINDWEEELRALAVAALKEADRLVPGSSRKGPNAFGRLLKDHCIDMDWPHNTPESLKQDEARSRAGKKGQAARKRKRTESGVAEGEP